jgi:hypothetical protein
LIWIPSEDFVELRQNQIFVPLVVVIITHQHRGFFKLLFFWEERGTTPTEIRARLAVSGSLKDIDDDLKQASDTEFG